MAAVNRVIVYGGKGALGSRCVQVFRSKGWVRDTAAGVDSSRSTCSSANLLCVSVWCKQWVTSIDMAANDEADENIIVKLCESFTDQAAQVSCSWSSTRCSPHGFSARTEQRSRDQLSLSSEARLWTTVC